jgi:eukaryotic-like serine/threonine-protein kinase
MELGTRVGPYEIIGRIGAGGMGEVYRARDTKLGRDVAIKTLPSELAKDPDRLARFDREAKLLAALNHAHIAAIYGLDEHAGTQYLAMELIEGETLEQKLKNGALPLEDALRLALQVAEALEAAHDKGVVHRDLKPANVMVTPDGQVKVLDFGLAKAFGGDPSGAVPAHSPTLSAAMTKQGLILGTAGYMSPEQASGQATDQRADVWAFGVVLYEMLTGLPVFSGESVPHILADVLRTEPDWRRLPKGLPPRLKLLLERCLKKKVRDRYHSIADVRVELEDLLRDPQHGAVGSPARAAPRWRYALPAVITLVLGAVFASAYFMSRPPVAPARSAAAPPSVSRFTITPPPEAPLANLGGYDLAISPDGKRIAYVAENAEHAGVVDLYVRELDQLDARVLPAAQFAAPSGGDVNPFFSADGRSIAFSARDRGGLVRVGIDGAPPLKIADSPSPFLGATWTADDKLLMSTGRQLVRRSVNGSAEEVLTPEDPDAFVMSPVPLPGGRAVLFGRLKDNVESVAVVDLSTGEQKTLIENAQNATYTASGHIVYARGTTLMAAPFDPAELSLTGEPVSVLQGVRHPNPTTAADYAVSANGTLAYVPAGSEAVQRAALAWVDRAGKVEGWAVGELIESPHSPRLSPDGTRVVVARGTFSASTLWSYDLRGRPPIPLGTGSGNEMPVWSSDGRDVAFVEIGSGFMVTIRGDGSGLAQRQLRGERISGGPAHWLATGDLLFVQALAKTGIQVVSTKTDTPVRDVIVNDYEAYDPALSPDGHWLAYASNRTGAPEVWVQAYPEGAAVRVSARGGYEPRWSADGKELFYLQDMAMMAVRVQPGSDFSFAAPVELFRGGFVVFPDPFIGSYDVARDGRFLMIQQDEEARVRSGSASIVVVQNWTEELKRLVPARK